MSQDRSSSASTARDVAVFVDGGPNLLDALRERHRRLRAQVRLRAGHLRRLHRADRRRAAPLLPDAGRDREGRAVETADGLQDGPDLHPLQHAFMEHFAAQCGFCTPGMLMAAKALLDRNPAPSRDEVVEAISGNICRCTGYEPIINAVLAAAARRPAPRLKEHHHARIPQGDLRRRARRQSQGDRQADTQRQDMLGHVTGTSPYFDDHAARACCTSRCCAARTHHARIRRIDASAAERAPGVRRVIRGADVPRQPQHAAEPDQLRQGRRAVARGRQGPLQGRADRRHRRRQRARGATRRWPRCGSITSRCRRSSTSRRR